MKTQLFFLCLLAAAFGCSKQPELQADEIYFGSCKSFQANGMDICFVSLNEYRCPCGIICLWEGAVDVGLRVSIPTTGIDTTLVLTSDKRFDRQTAIIDGHTIKLKDASAPDFCDDYGVAEKYRVQVDID